MRCRKVVLVLLVGCAIVLGWVALAGAQGMTVDLDHPEEEAPVATRVTLGLGPGLAPDYEGSEDYRFIPILLVKAEAASGQSFEFVGTTARGNLVPSSTWAAGPMLRYRGERDDVDNNRVDRMKKIDAAWEFGAFGKVVYQRFFGKVEYAYDLADAHEGWLFTLTGGYTLPLNPSLTLTGSLSTTYVDKDYMDTYFGVDQADANRSGLDPYAADGGFKDVTLTGLCSYRFLPQWSVLGALRYTRLVGEAEDSPLVDDVGNANQWLLGAVVAYTF